MRRHTFLVLLLGFAGSGPVAAQGLGFLFGEPPSGIHRAPRSHQRHGSEPIDVPVPVPRPHFPGDDASSTAGLPAADAPPSTDATSSVEATPVTPPLPPERPPTLAPPPEIAVGETDKTGAAKRASSATPAPIEPARPASSKTELEASTPLPTQIAPLPPEKPAELVAKPVPSVAPSGATTAFDPREPAADAGCADRLKARGVSVEDATLGPQPDERCTVVQPMRLVSATVEDGSTVSFPDKPTIACTTADAFSAYVHDLLAPLAKGTWGTSVTSVWTGPGLECRSRDHIFGAKLSAHGQGLAIDIAQLKLGDGRLVAVGEPKTDAERDFETAARAGGCGYFHTVLGPGSDSYHRTHWHFDLEVRGKDGDSKYCK